MMYTECEKNEIHGDAQGDVAASHIKGEASFLTEEAVDSQFLQSAIAETGYSCLNVEAAPYEKKGLFGWR